MFMFLLPQRFTDTSTYESRCEYYWCLNMRLPFGERRPSRFWPIPHSRSMCNLNGEMTLSSDQQAPSRPVVAERELAHPSTPRPISLCQPFSGPLAQKDLLSRSTRRFSEVPRELEEDFSRFLFDEDRDATVYQLSKLSGGTRQPSTGPQPTPLSIPPRQYAPSTCESSLSTPTINPDTLGTDALSSVYDFEIYDFPEPPPMGSPVIRRIHSSPWVAAREERRTYPYTPSPEAQTFGLNSSNVFHRKDVPNIPSYVDVFGSENGFLPEVDVAEEERYGTRVGCKRRSVCGVLLNPSLFEDSSTMDGTCVASLLTHARSSTLSSAKQDTGSEWPSEDTVGAAQKPFKEQPVAPRLPRIIRKVASMQTQSKRGYPSVLPTTRNGQRPLPKVRSFHSILGNTDNKQSMPRDRRESWHMSAERFWAARKEPEVTNSRAMKELRPEKKGKETQGLRISKRFSASVDISEAGSSLAPSGTRAPEKGDHSQSFLDFGPNPSRDSGVTKDKVRTLLSRASGFFVQWKRKAKQN
ncbi:hypothetical protein CPB83DRAFT_76285 [Crepidotus variabilis]|uniref:Uncharacterized protein n=1 Tax=Crepidotus variabilis TaxID=179855 RepID=A0A9P6JS52_9AGAR|nr:hypothetical protein CPB83DRAFT_76285 [Crepidotus variabilis]